jgi:hypothetical protein
MSDAKQYHQYFSSRPKISITMPNGNRIYFVAGTYVTDNESEVEFLNEQIKHNHPMIFIQKGKETVTQEQLDPLAAIKEKVIAEYLSKQAEQQNPNRDMGRTDAVGAGVDVATTRTLAPITMNSKSK